MFHEAVQLCFGSDLASVESLSTSLRVLLVLRVLDIVLDLKIYGVLRMAAWAAACASSLRNMLGACGSFMVGGSVHCSLCFAISYLGVAMLCRWFCVRLLS